MGAYHRFGSTGRHLISPHAELLENRALLSGAAASQVVAIQVPSAYVSQQADQLTVTLLRSSSRGNNHKLGPLTVDFSASTGSTTSGGSVSTDSDPPQFTPVHESVTFPQGVTTETVVVPINSGAPNPGLVPVQLGVTPVSHAARGSKETVYLATSLEAVPPSIIAIQRVAGGIALTFSKPMDRASVENIHNYAVKFSPTQKFSLAALTGVGLIQTLNYSKQSIGLKRASYDAATNTVTLVPSDQLGSEGSYTISNPSSLVAKGKRPKKAQALTDLQGNPLGAGGRAGVFSITISKGHPYSAVMPVLSNGS